MRNSILAFEKAHEEYFEIPANKMTNNSNYLRLSVFYDLGGENCFSGTIEPRGVYFSFCPMHRVIKNGIIVEESYIAGRGKKYCLKPMGRKSQKQIDRAIDVVQRMQGHIVNALINNNESLALAMVRTMIRKMEE